MDARAAAERAEKAIKDQQLETPFIPVNMVKAILAEFAPLLAAQDAECERLKAAYETQCSGVMSNLQRINNLQYERDRLVAEADMLRSMIHKGLEDRDRLAAEVAELRRDAERYLALLDQCESVFRTQFIDLGDCEAFKAAEQIRAVLDAALAAQKT